MEILVFALFAEVKPKSATVGKRRKIEASELSDTSSSEEDVISGDENENDGAFKAKIGNEGVTAISTGIAALNTLPDPIDTIYTFNETRFSLFSEKLGAIQQKVLHATTSEEEQVKLEEIFVSVNSTLGSTLSFSTKEIDFYLEYMQSQNSIMIDETSKTIIFI